jgi:acyl-CoA synthetase (AMP-forming)/AMP-acid ligase II
MSFDIVNSIQIHGSADLLGFNGEIYTGSDLLNAVTTVEAELARVNFSAGDVVHLRTDYSILGVASLIAIYSAGGIVIPHLPSDFDTQKLKLINEIKNITLGLCESGFEEVIRTSPIGGEMLKSPLIHDLRVRKSPGLILFTSGTTGEPKGVIHDFELLLSKFTERPETLKPFRSVAILMFDHWGGLNTLFHSLFSGGFLALIKDRKPDLVAEEIQKHKLNLLPASPSFLNIFLLKGSFQNFDLSSLRWITYGAEPMPEATLNRMNHLLPGIKFKQTYGLIEIGVLSTVSESDKSTLVKLGGDGYDIRIVDDMLEIKAKTSMLGYLNADSPFTSDGYFKTGDVVEQHGDYFKILGRRSNLIFTGGEKVYPSEIESVILNCEWVEDVKVYGVPHPLLGKVIAAQVQTNSSLDHGVLRGELRSFCMSRLSRFKVPMQIDFTSESLVSSRLKKERK